MCVEPDSSPPIEPTHEGRVVSADLVLEGPDGNRFSAFQTTPAEPSGLGVVILPDVRGLFRFYKELALRFAERGHTALAIDYFGRTAGTTPRDDDFPFRQHVESTTPEGLHTDITAAVEHLRSPTGGASENVFTVGFCFGGRQSWLATTWGIGLAGAIGFYGRPGRAQDGSNGPTQLASQIDAPILALQAGDDEFIPTSENDAFEQALTGAAVPHELITYHGAPHSFFDRRHHEFTTDSEDAWHRVLMFLERFST